MNAIDVVVTGTFTTGVPEMDKRAVYTSVQVAQQLLVTQRVSSLGVFLDRIEATGAARERWPRNCRNCRCRPGSSRRCSTEAVRGLYNRIFGALGLIIAVIVVFVVTSAMAMAVIERTREIGTLRALGTLPSQLLRSLGLEGMLLGGLGALAGAAVALAVSAISSDYRKHLYFHYENPLSPINCDNGQHHLRPYLDGNLPYRLR